MNKLTYRIDVGIILIFLLSITIPVMAQDTTAVSSATDTIAPGVQGSINPMRDYHNVLTGDELLDKSFPNSIPIFATGVRLRIGGYVKADFIRDFQYVADPYEFELGSIAVEGTPERELGGTTTFQAKETRIGFDLRSKAKWGNGVEFPLRVFVEFDWFFDSPTMALNTRLRHAYGVIGRLLFGRTWTTSGNLAALPGIIDFSGGDALYGGRVGQIRWQDKLAESFVYAVALEEPSAQISNPYNLEGTYRPLWPNIAGMVKWQSTAGSSIQLGADAFPVSWKGPATVPNESKVGYSIIVMSRLAIKVTEYQDAFTWGGGFGEGQGGKIIALSWDRKASGVITPYGLDLAPAWFAYAGYNHYWNKSLNSTISTNWAGIELSPYESDNTIQKAGSFHINLVWFPYSLVSTGIEYMWGMRQNKDGVQGTASRIQFMAKFKFN